VGGVISDAVIRFPADSGAPHEEPAGHYSVRELDSISKPKIPLMKTSTRNQASGTAKIAKGKTKAVAGKVTRNRTMQAKGRAQEMAGKMQRAVGTRQKNRGE
jgi:uncharacterized protein YjbJ (UPF0337 family)